LENTQEKKKEERKKIFNLDARNVSREIKKFANNDGITIDIISESRIGNEVVYKYTASGKNMFKKKNAKD